MTPPDDIGIRDLIEDNEGDRSRVERIDPDGTIHTDRGWVYRSTNSLSVVDECVYCGATDVEFHDGLRCVDCADKDPA